jgi:hypothetical protein
MVYNFYVIIKRKISALGAMFLFFLITFSLFSVFLTPKVQAEANFESNIIKYFSLEAFERCINNVSISTKLIKGDTETVFGYADARVFYKSGTTITVGYVADPENGQRTCGTPKNAEDWFRYIGYKNFNDFRDENYKVENDYRLELKEDRDTVIAMLRDKIKKAKPSLSDAQKYFNFFKSFEKCSKGPMNKNDISGSTIKIENFVKIDGTEVKPAYFKDEKGDDQIPVGHNSGANAKDGRLVCKNIAKQLEKYSAAYKEWATNPANTEDTSIATTGSTAEEDESCEAQSGVTGWILCPVIEMVGTALNWIDTQLQRLLTVDRDKYTSGELYTAWSRFRNIGLTILIAAMLLMVISTALGVSFLDAYTVKKAMPRMIMSVLFMILSWYICIFLIDLSNIVGSGTLGLMTSPFGDKATSLTQLFTPSAGGAALQIGGIAIGAVAVGFGVGVFGIVLSWLGTGLLIMAIAFLVLIARQMVIVVLILFAPLAILSWIFPNNNKLWGLWWGTFTKLLIMFPLIMALVASGRIFAGVLANTPGSGAEGLLNGLLKFTAYVIPYAFIPFTFKAAGGAFGNLVGMVNDKSRGAFDRLKKGRQQRMGQVGRNIKGGVGFRGSNNSLLNRATAGVASGPQGWMPTKSGRDRRRVSRETGMMIAGQAQLENDNTHKMWKNNDQYQLALADEDLANQMLKDKITEREQAVVNGDYDKVNALNQEIKSRQGAIAAAKSINNKTTATRRQAALELAATGYQLADGEAGYKQLEAMSRSIHGNDDAAHAQFMNTAQYSLGKAGRFDLAGINNGSGYDAKAGTDKASLYELANSKKQSIKGMVDAAGYPPTGRMTNEEAQNALVLQKELKSMQSSAKGATRDAIDKELLNLETRGLDSYEKLATGRTDSAGNPVMATVKESVTETYSPSAATAAKAAGDGWTADEIARGTRARQVEVTRPETNGDLAKARARTYKPPDPSEM